MRFSEWLREIRSFGEWLWQIPFRWVALGLFFGGFSAGAAAEITGSFLGFLAVVVFLLAALYVLYLRDRRGTR